MDTKVRNPGYDYLKAIACIGIIYLHTTFSTTLMYADRITPMQSLLCEIFMNNLMWAVPCFLMVTGALLLPAEKEIGYGPLFRKYIARILKAIVIFGLAFVLLEMIFNPDRRTGAYFLNGLYKIFTGDTWSHMWYLYCLIGLYLLLPAYKKVAANAEEKDIRYLLIVYAAFQSLLPLLDIGNVRCGFYIHVSSIYPFWLFLGYYLKRWGMRRKRSFYVWVFAVSTALLVVMTIVRMKWDFAALDTLFEYHSILVIGQAYGMAGWFFRCGAEGKVPLKKVLSKINEHSFGIYLIHMAFVRLIYKHLHFDPFTLNGALGITLVVLAAFVLSYLVDWALKKIPFFRGVL